MGPALRDVVVTGLGAVCALGDDAPGLWDAIKRGDCGIRPIRRFSTDDFRVSTGAEVRNSSAQAIPADRLCADFARQAAAEAIRHARLEGSGIPAHRVGLVFGTGLIHPTNSIHQLAEELAETLRIEGPAVTVATACCSSTGAIGLGRDLIASGSADVVLAGGSDVLSPETFAGFHQLGALNPVACAPFSLPFGTTLGEGAGFVTLERGALARERGAECIVALSGYGLSGDGHHETTPDPNGLGVARALRGALGDAQLPPTRIGYVNAHGTGTETNDRSEWRGIQRGLGAHSQEVLLSSSKGALGHAQGAAGVLEIIVTILCMRRELVPPTLNWTIPRRYGPPDPVPGPYPRPWSYGHALCLNSAFGGANAAVVISRAAGKRKNRARRPIEILGVGAATPRGIGFVLSDPGSPFEPQSPLSIRQLLPRADLRGLDPSSQFLTAATAACLADAGVTIRGRLRDRIGLIMGCTRTSPASVRAFTISVEERGLPGLSASAFARIVLHAPAGFCSKILELRGPLNALTIGTGTGLIAIAHAAEILSTRDDVDLMVAAAVDENAAGEAVAAPAGAISILMGTSAHDRKTGPRVRLAGWGIAGPGRINDAIRDATGGEHQPNTRVDRVFRERDWGDQFPGYAHALPSALAFGAAFRSLQRGESARSLVTSDQGRSAVVAILLTNGPTS